MVTYFVTLKGRGDGYVKVLVAVVEYMVKTTFDDVASTPCEYDVGYWRVFVRV